MAGYHNYSMSNNAVDAYRNGEMPISKWTKGDILNAIKEIVDDIAKFKKLTVKQLKDNFLRKSSWHHTSNHYNRTDFYSVNESNVEDFNNGKFTIEKETKITVETVKKNMIEIRYAVWGGTKKHPRITGYETMIGEEKGDWCVDEYGKKKKISSQYVEVLKRWNI
jgi:hypothetical protein